MKTKNIFQKDFWIIDVPAGVTFGFCLGYLLQETGDSGVRNFDKMLFMGFYTSFVYLLTSVLALRLKNKFPQIPSWIWISVLGGVIFTFFGQIVAFVNDWHYFKTVSLTEYIASRAEGEIKMLFAGSIMFSLLLFVPLLFLRSTFFIFVRLKTLLR